VSDVGEPLNRLDSKRLHVFFHEGDLSESEILEEQVIENIQRRSLQPIEEAKAFAALIEMNGWKGKDVAASLGIHPAKVSRGLALLKLPADVQAQVESGELPTRTAYEISKLPTGEQQRRIAKDAKQSGLTNLETANRVRVARGKKSRSTYVTRLSFKTSCDVDVIVSRTGKTTYEEIEVALSEALSEVQHRIENNVQII
jgi:ParB family chromosome partitioning protein